MPEAGAYRCLEAVSAGCVPRLMMLPRVPRLMMLPRVRSCPTKRWRAAAMLPQLQPPPIFDPSQTHEKVKPGGRIDVTLRQPRAQERKLRPPARGRVFTRVRGLRR